MLTQAWEGVRTTREDAGDTRHNERKKPTVRVLHQLHTGTDPVKEANERTERRPEAQLKADSMPVLLLFSENKAV